MRKSIKSILTILLLALAFNFSSPSAEAQCPMCRMTAEKNLENGGTAGRGLNQGILYILALPYLLVLGVGVVWYRNRKAGEEQGYDIIEE